MLCFQCCLVFPKDLGDSFKCLRLAFPGHPEKDYMIELQMIAKVFTIFFEKLIFLQLFECYFNDSRPIYSSSAIEPVLDPVDIVVIKEVYGCKFHCLELV